MTAPVRVSSASDSEIVLGLRDDRDPESILADPATEECQELHLGTYDMIISVTNRSGGDGAPDTTILESTDGSTPPTRPTTDTTAP